MIGRQKRTELQEMCTDFLEFATCTRILILSGSVRIFVQFSFLFFLLKCCHTQGNYYYYSSLISDSARIVFTPGNHWSGRFPPLDRNKALWGSWLVVGSKGSKFWFGGDTAYSDVFKQIGKKFGPIDLSAIPIGAYNPR